MSIHCAAGAGHFDKNGAYESRCSGIPDVQLAVTRNNLLLMNLMLP
jgi:hypothetical protein